MSDKLAAVADALRRRKVARFPAVEVEGQMPKRVAVDVPPEFQAQEAELAKVQNLGQPEAQQRPSSIPAQVSQAMMGATQAEVRPPPVREDDESDIEAARAADRESRFNAGMELAGRQLVGALTRTQVPQGLGANPSEVPLAMARAKSKREQAAEALRAQRQATMDASTLDLQKSQAERNRRDPADAPMTPYQASVDADRDADREVRKAIEARKAEEAERKRVAAVAAVKAKNADKAKKEGIAAETRKIPAFGGMFSPLAGTEPNDTVTNRARANAGFYNAAVSGMDGLAKAVSAYAAHPSPATKREVDAQVSGVAAAVTAAHGGGAMADSEFERQKAALGADTMSAAGLQAVIETALGSPDGAAALLSKLKSSRASLVEMAKARLASDGFPEFKGPDAAPQSPGPGYVRGKFGNASGWYNAKINDWKPD